MIRLTLVLLLLSPSFAAAQGLWPHNWGQEWYQTPGPMVAQTCGDSQCLSLPAYSTVVSVTYNLTNYHEGQVVLFVLIASPDGTPWHAQARRLFSTVIQGQGERSGALPGPHVFQEATRIFWAAQTYQLPDDARLPHLEQQTTVYTRR